MKHRRSIAKIFFFLGITLVLVGGFTFYQSRVASAHNSSGICIQYGAFTRSVAFIEAQARGYFAQEGLNVCYNQVSSSTQQFNSLLSGQYDIISTTADNVVNRYVNSNLPVQIVDGIDQGSGLQLVGSTANGINSIADLKGKPIAVDAPNSGYVFALEKIMADNGLSLANGDYSLQVIGGSLQRFNAIQAGSFNGAPVYATILGTPFSEQAHDVSTLISLAKFSDHLAPYQGSTLATTRSYAQANSATLKAFIKATIRGRLFAANPFNKSTVVADIASTFGVSTQTATDIYTDAQDLVSGENTDELLNPAGLKNTIDLRQQFGGFTQPLSAIQEALLLVPGKTSLYDAEYWVAACVEACAGLPQ